MEWSSTAISWDLQVMLMWIVLPPVFVFSMLLTLITPVLLANAEKRKAHRQEVLPKHAMVEIGR